MLVSIGGWFRSAAVHVQRAQTQVTEVLRRLGLFVHPADVYSAPPACQAPVLGTGDTQ